MKLALVVMLACRGNYIDPDGENVFFYEECLHMNRGQFTEELHNKCKKYSDMKLEENVNSQLSQEYSVLSNEKDLFGDEYIGMEMSPYW